MIKKKNYLKYDINLNFIIIAHISVLLKSWTCLYRLVIANVSILIIKYNEPYVHLKIDYNFTTKRNKRCISIDDY